MTYRNLEVDLDDPGETTAEWVVKPDGSVRATRGSMIFHLPKGCPIPYIKQPGDTLLEKDGGLFYELNQAKRRKSRILRGD